MRYGMFERVRNSGKKQLKIIPFIFTFANALFGFLAVVKTLDEHYASAAWCIVLAAIMDMLDGRLARLIGSSSYVGRELDSLCDAVSFCFAPAILVYSWLLYPMGPLGLVVLGLFLCCGLFRLARFNVIYESQTNYFTGLPTTIAAFFLSQIVLNEEWINQSVFNSMLRPERIAFIVSIVGLLMISSIKFPSSKYLHMRLAIMGVAIGGGILSAWAFMRGYPVFLFLVTLYIIGGFLLGIFKEIVRPLFKR